MEDEEETTGYLIPDKVYDGLKWVGLIALPALAVCVQTIGTAAGWAGTDLTVTIPDRPGHPRRRTHRRQHDQSQTFDTGIACVIASQRPAPPACSAGERGAFLVSRSSAHRRVVVAPVPTPCPHLAHIFRKTRVKPSKPRGIEEVA